MLPILLYGPGNQLVGFKQAAVVARLLGRDLLLPSFHAHHTHTAQLVTPDDVFSVPSLSRFINFSTVGEQKATSGSLALDAVVVATATPCCPVSNYISRSQRQLGYTVKSQVEQHFHFGRCSAEEDLAPLQNLTHLRAIGLVIYDGHLPPSHSQCGNLLETLTSLLLAPWPVRLGAARLAHELGDAPLHVVHVRPMPDACLAVWKSARPPKPSWGAPGDCEPHSGELLRSSLVKTVAAVPASHAVYIICHPSIQPAVAAFLQAGGVERPIATWGSAVAANASQLRDVDDITSFLIELELAAHAAAFVGARGSSNTERINDERRVRGLPLSKSLA